MSDLLFQDRHDAGRRLAQKLLHLKAGRPVVLALPRGGVPVGYEIAAALDAPLDLLLVRKIGAPWQPELAVGAVVDGRYPHTVLNEDVVQSLGIPESYIEAERARQVEEIERRRAVYLQGRTPADVAGRAALVVDDGIATGATVRVALRAVRRAGARWLVLAVPVAPADIVERLREEADEVVVLAMPDPFIAVGAHYRDFRQLDDAEVIALLDAPRPGPEPG